MLSTLLWAYFPSSLVIVCLNHLLIKNNWLIFVVEFSEFWYRISICLWSICINFYTWCDIWAKIIFCMWIPSYYFTICWKLHSIVNCFCAFVEMQLSIKVWSLLETLSVPCSYLTILMTILHCLDYCSLIICLEWGSLSTFLRLKVVLAILYSLYFHMNIKTFVNI